MEDIGRSVNDISWPNASLHSLAFNAVTGFRICNIDSPNIQSTPLSARTGGQYFRQAFENMERETGLEPA